MLHVGWVSVSPLASTGYGVITKELGYRIIDAGMSLTFIGSFGDIVIWGGVTDQLTPKGNKAKTLILTVPQSASQVINEYIRAYKITLIVGFLDCFGLEYLNNVKVPVIGYIPIDGPFTAQMKNYMRNFRKIIAYSQFGYKELQKWYPPSKIGLIEHGIDTEVFKPLNKSEYDEAREFLLEKYGIPKDAFLAVEVGANVGPRKLLPQLMRTFSKFAENKNTHLFIMTNAYNPGKGFDLIAHRATLNMQEKIHFPENDPILFPLLNEELRQLYGASQVFVHNAVAEGRGMPLIEAMGCGIPLIAPNNSAQTEIVKDHGWLVDIIDPEDFIEYPVYVPTLQEYPMTSQKSLLEKLEQCYAEPELREKFGAEARKFVIKRFSWDVIVPQWIKMLNQIEAEMEIFDDLLSAIK